VPAEASGLLQGTATTAVERVTPVERFARDSPVPQGGQFTPPHKDSGLDLNGNGLYDFLNVSVTIVVDAADNYTVGGFLTKETTSLNLYNQSSAYLAPGTWTLSVLYDGPLINSSGVDGPYNVSLTLWLSDQFRNPLDTASYTTHPYRHTDFDARPAEFAPPHSDAGVDTDGDGRFNLLDVNVSLSVQVGADYYLNAVLFDSTYNITLFASDSMRLDPGRRIVVLAFSGEALNASGVDGPYFVSMGLFSSPGRQLIDSGSHVTAAYNHTQFEEPPVINSPYARTTPVIDGAIASGEWTNAHTENLATVPGNQVPAFLHVMNDATFLYIAYDAVGDRTDDANDTAAVGFDTGNDGMKTFGQEDEFLQGGLAPGHQAHYTFAGGDTWTIHDSPFNPDLPNQTGLAGAWGFGPSPADSSPHRTYEFRLPLTLLLANPGDTLGFFAGSHAPIPGGVFDANATDWSSWPVWNFVPIPLAAYGDVVLATQVDTVPPMITITSPTAGAVFATDSVTLAWTATDEGTGLDHFEVQVDNQVPTTVAPSNTSYNATRLPEGPHTLSVTAFDAAGNSRSASVQITVDSSPPTLHISAPRDGGFLGSSTLAVSWTVEDSGSGVAKIEITVDSGAPVSLSTSATRYTISSVLDGRHTINVTAIDFAGNRDTDRIRLTIDTVPPDVAITSPMSGSVVPSSDVTVSFTDGDAWGIARVEIALDGESPQALDLAATSLGFTSLSDGGHRVDVTVYDRAGNSRTATTSFQVDTSFLSIHGPYGYGGIGVVTALALGAVVAGIAIVRRRGGLRPPRSLPRTSPLGDRREARRR
jgi:hypothetical protein